MLDSSRLGVSLWGKANTLKFTGQPITTEILYA
jgi:hypothetical protein